MPRLYKGESLMKNKREFRFLSAEMRAEQDGDKNYISGYAAVFNSLSEEMWGFRERVMPGAFKRSLEEKADGRQLINHDASLLLGRTKSGTLELNDDDKRLTFPCMTPKPTYSNNLIDSTLPAA